MNIVLGILLIAAVATAGDYIWYTYGVRHQMPAGIIHGALLLTAVGGVLGALQGRLLRGLPIGTIAGIGGALAYYVLVEVMDSRTYGTAIPAAWVLMWLMLAALEGRWLRAPFPRSWSSIAVRGVVAAVLGGLAFYSVVTVLWGRPPAGGRNYFVQWLAWAWAWTPGIVALAAGGRGRGANSGSRGSSSASSSGSGRAEIADSSVSPTDLLMRIDRGEPVHILDVRSEGEFAAGHVPGAVNVPFTQVLGRASDLPGAPGEELIVYCGHGPRAYMAGTALRAAGRTRLVYLTGHWSAWQSAGLRTER